MSKTTKRMKPTRALFKQESPHGTEDIHEWREKFVSAEDPTEYEGALALGMTWKEWCTFKEHWPNFQKKYLNDWLDEIEIRIKSKAIKSLCQTALVGTKGTSAAKFIAEGKYKEKQVGRPTNDQVKRQTKIDARLEREYEEDIKRVMGIVNDR